MIHESRMNDYRSRMLEAKELAAVHDCKYYVYDTGDSYQVSCARSDDYKMVGEVWPGGRMVAHGLMRTGGILR